MTLLDPALSNTQVVEAVQSARRDRVAAVTVRACDVDLAVRHWRAARSAPGAIVGYPHGFPSTAVKLYEARDLLRRGARRDRRGRGRVQTALPRVPARPDGAEPVHRDLPRGRRDADRLLAVCPPDAGAEDHRLHLLRSGRKSRSSAMDDISDLELLRKHLPDETADPGLAARESRGSAEVAGARRRTRMATTSTAAILRSLEAAHRASAHACDLRISPGG